MMKSLRQEWKETLSDKLNVTFYICMMVIGTIALYLAVNAARGEL